MRKAHCVRLVKWVKKYLSANNPSFNVAASLCASTTSLCMPSAFAVRPAALHWKTVVTLTSTISCTVTFTRDRWKQFWAPVPRSLPSLHLLWKAPLTSEFLHSNYICHFWSLLSAFFVNQKWQQSTVAAAAKWLFDCTSAGSHFSAARGSINTCTSFKQLRAISGRDKFS